MEVPNETEKEKAKKKSPPIARVKKQRRIKRYRTIEYTEKVKKK